MEPVPIQVRRMHFDLESAPRYWHSGSPYLTHHFTAMSLFFPPGEQFFIDSVRAYQDEITDPRLAAEVRAFAAQESQHSHHHRAYDRWVSRQGVPVPRYERIVKRGLDLLERIAPPKAQLALTIALEHFTAVFADLLLRDPRFTEGMDPRVKDLWLWHAVEETEHKAVAFDVFQQVSGSYWLRAFMMARVMVGFPLAIGLAHFCLMAGDGQLGNWRDNWSGFRRVWGRGGFFRAAIPELLVFFRRDFHPWHYDNRARIDVWAAEQAQAAGA